MEIVSLKRASLLPDLAPTGPPLSRRGTHEALRAGFWGLKQPTFYIYEMVVPVRRRLHVKESKWAEPTVQVWPHNVFLCKYLEMQAAREGPNYFADKTVLELGAGCGLTGMVAAMLGASVTVVEGAALFHHLRHNIDAFSAEWKGKLQIRCEEEGAALGKLRSGDNETENSLFDFIICSDVSTAKELPYSFLLTLLELMGERSEVLLCHTRSCSLEAPDGETDTDHGRFMARLSEIFQVEEVESEDTIRAFCDQLTGGAQLLRSQSTIDIQECSDAEGRLIILRLTCSRKIEGLKDYVHKQLKKEATLQPEGDTLKASVPTNPDRTTTADAHESGSAEKDGVLGKTRAKEPQTTVECWINEADGVTCKDTRISATSVRRSSHKRTFSGARDSRHTGMAAAGWVRSRIIRPRIAAGAKGDCSPSAGGVALRTRSDSSSSGRAPSAERCATAGDAQKSAAGARLPSRVMQPSAAQSRSVATSKKVVEHVDAPPASSTQDKVASPTNKRLSEKVQRALPVGDKARMAPVSAVRLRSASSTTCTQLSSHLGKTSTQGSPSSGLRSRTLTSAFKDKGGMLPASKGGKIGGMSGLQAKAPSSPLSADGHGQQVLSRRSTMTAVPRAIESGPTLPSCSPPRSRALPSSVIPPQKPASVASRLLSRRGHSAAPKGIAVHNSAPQAAPRNPARPSSTVEPAHALTSGTKTRGSVHAYVEPARLATLKETRMENRSPSPTAPRTPYCQQRSGDAAGLARMSKGTLASSKLPLKSRSTRHSAQCESASPEKGVIRGLSSTLYGTGGSPERRCYDQGCAMNIQAMSGTAKPANEAGNTQAQ